MTSRLAAHTKPPTSQLHQVPAYHAKMPDTWNLSPDIWHSLSIVNSICYESRGRAGHTRSFDQLRQEPVFLPTRTLAKERRSSNARLALWQGLILRQKIGLAGAHRAVLASLVPSASRKNNQRRLSATALKALPAASIVRSMSSSLCAPDMKSVSNCDGAR